MGATNIFTQTLTSGSLSITAANNVQKVSAFCTSGTVTVSGTTAFQGLSSQAIPIAVGSGVTLSASVTSNPLDGITINASAGTVQLIISTS